MVKTTADNYGSVTRFLYPRRGFYNLYYCCRIHIKSKRFLCFLLLLFFILKSKGFEIVSAVVENTYIVQIVLLLYYINHFYYPTNALNYIKLRD